MILDLEMKYLIEIPSSNVNLIDPTDERWKVEARLPGLGIHYSALLTTLFIVKNGGFSVQRITFIQDFVEISQPTIK